MNTSVFLLCLLLPLWVLSLSSPLPNFEVEVDPNVPALDTFQISSFTYECLVDGTIRKIGKENSLDKDGKPVEVWSYGFMKYDVEEDVSATNNCAHLKCLREEKIEKIAERANYEKGLREYEECMEKCPKRPSEPSIFSRCWPFGSVVTFATSDRVLFFTVLIVIKRRNMTKGKEHWIAKAIRHPGSLTAWEKRHHTNLQGALHAKNKKIREKANLAKTLKGFHHKK